MSLKTFSVFIVFTIFTVISSDELYIENGKVSLNISISFLSMKLSLQKGSSVKLFGEIGTRLTNISNHTKCLSGIENCIEFPQDQTRLHILKTLEDGFRVYWTSANASNVIEDCFDLQELNWFGGPERFEQEWPLEKLNLTDFANVVQEDQWGAVIEPYWLNSLGGYIFIDRKVPLFINQNTLVTGRKVCFKAQAAAPYPNTRRKVVLQYNLVATDDPKKGHQHAVRNFLGKPSGHPNHYIIEHPIWSTWARYKRDVNDSAVLQFAKEIADYGYTGQFEIDDDWEDCYGALTFRHSKFGDINNTVAAIKKLNFTVTLWVHPFVNTNCKKWENIGRRYDFFVKSTNGSDLTKWWNSKAYEAHYLDFTNPEVREWFVDRLQNIKNNHGIDSFKFDAGETSWNPQVPVLSGDIEEQPNNIAENYVRTCARLGDLVEVRVGWRTQDLPVFVRMIDKDSVWDSVNGLYTLITTLLQMNMNGYTNVLPDMVGGNGYFGRPNDELFIRWLQANVFMPSIQFSYVPWDYPNSKNNVRDISWNMVELHRTFAPYIIHQLEGSVQNGTPVNPPIWWIDPSDPAALAEDTEFLLGEDVLSAPVIEEGARHRNVYLPIGTWVDGNNGTIYKGPTLLKNYPAPIEILPYFVRQGSFADKLNGVKSGAPTVVLR